jgi:PHD/YefM family antitoxin component YafN of YafNO toxin-antitoxin module
MDWNISTGKEQFSLLVKQAGSKPQFIKNRESLVAVMISPGEYEQFELFKKEQQRSTLADEASRVREICVNEKYHLQVPKRQDRDVEFP